MALYQIRLNLEPSEASDVYTVTSPDLPELITEGSTPEEIARNVQDAINSLVKVYHQQSWPLPPALRPEKAVPIEEVTTIQVAA